MDLPDHELTGHELTPPTGQQTPTACAAHLEVALGRRRCVIAGLAAGAHGWLGAAQALTKPQTPVSSSAPAGGEGSDTAQRSSLHFPFGPVVPPRTVSPWAVSLHDGRLTDLQRLLTGRVTAMQLMFTTCSALCPIQGALFAQAQERVGPDAAIQFVSMTIDPRQDTPQRLASWRAAFQAQARWCAVAPRVEDVLAIRELLTQGGERGQPAVDAHPGQVYFLDRRAALIHRTPALPRAEQIAQILRDMAQRGPSRGS